MMKRARYLLGGALLLCEACGGRGARVAVSPAADSCSVREVSRHPLILDNGQELYVAPRTFESNVRGERLLAGTPNYIFARGPDGRGMLVARDSVLGALIDARGNARIIPAPIDPHLVTGVRALARADGSWNVVFGERDGSLHDEVSSMDDPIVALWHGVHDGTRWTSLDSIPFPPAVRLSAAGISISPLAGNTDHGLAWAVGAVIAHGREGVIVFRRNAGSWSHEIVPTRSASLGGLLYAASGDLLLAVIAADTAIPPGGSDRNSLFLWSSRGGAWTVARRVVLGGREGPVLSASLASLAGDTVITWAADVGGGYALRAQTSAAGEVKTVDGSLAEFYRFASTMQPDASPVWVTVHAPLSTPGGETRLRFARLSPTGEVQAIADLPNPVLDSFRITPGHGEADLLLTGAAGVEDAGIVVSLVVRYRLRCPAAAR